VPVVAEVNSAVQAELILVVVEVAEGRLKDQGLADPVSQSFATQIHLRPQQVLLDHQQ
jgi:hypothetical protein